MPSIGDSRSAINPPKVFSIRRGSERAQKALNTAATFLPPRKTPFLTRSVRASLTHVPRLIRCGQSLSPCRADLVEKPSVAAAHLPGDVTFRLRMVNTLMQPRAFTGVFYRGLVLQSHIDELCWFHTIFKARVAWKHFHELMAIGRKRLPSRREYSLRSQSDCGVKGEITTALSDRQERRVC